MKIYIIRHAKVNMKWPKQCNSNEFDTACMIYNRSDIKKINNANINISNDNIYVSGMKRSIRTAQILFPTSKYHIVSSISEVPLKSFTDTNSSFPLWLWNIIGRVQWFFNSSRQDEKRKDTILRAKKIIIQLENRDEDCVLVTHGFYMKTLLQVLKNKGYNVHGNKLFKFSNLQIVLAEND